MATNFKVGDLEYDILRKILDALLAGGGGGGGGSGSVTSVGLSMPSIFNVSGSPVTNAGTIAVTLNSQPLLLESTSGAPAKLTVLSGVGGLTLNDIFYAVIDTAGTPDSVKATIQQLFNTGIGLNASAALVAADIFPSVTAADSIARAATVQQVHNSIGALANAGALSVADIVAVVQSGVAGKTTLQGIVDLTAPSQTVLTYAATTDIDFNLAAYRTLALTGNVTFTTSNRAAAKSVTVKILCDGTPRTFTFPAWKFMSTAPTGIAAGKTGILSVTAFGANDSDCVAAYAVEA